MGWEDVDASVAWKEPDRGDSAGCAGTNLGVVGFVESARRGNMDALVSVDARCKIGAGFLDGTS
jgi:hypothetical protein